MSDFWIPITYEEETAQKLTAAVAACRRVHVFTLQTLNEYFIDHADNLLLGNFRHELATFLSRNKKRLPAQHYSLTKAAEQTFPYYTENKKINDQGKFIAVKAIPPKKYKNIQIETRQVWRKYLALNSLITTTHGTVFLDEQQWTQIMANQAAEKKIGFDTVPFLWHSVVIHVDPVAPKLRFNLHEPDTKFGRRSKKAMKLHV